MKRKWILLLLLLIVPGLLFTVSCATKTVQSDPGAVEEAVNTSAKEAEEAARQAELEKQKELERQKQLEEERLQAERIKEEEMARQAATARNLFENEDIGFDFDSAVLTYQAQSMLKAKAEWLRANGNETVNIEGHCDERGTNAYNLALGERRADSAKDFLANLGIAETRMTTISYGEEKPIDSAANEEAWAKNRRAHFVVE